MQPTLKKQNQALRTSLKLFNSKPALRIGYFGFNLVWGILIDSVLLILFFLL
jgi:hypothetical protein